MKRFSELWQRMSRLRVSFVRPGRETNPLAEQVLESLRSSTESLRHAVKLVEELQAELARARWELLAYFQSSMEPDAQVAELEGMRTREKTQKDV